MKYGTASVCIPPCHVKQAKDYVGDRLVICTVIGFPTGYHTSAVKVYEAEDAIRNGADELDMVINLGWVKEGRYEDIRTEIKALKTVCGDKVLKVIIETCLLTDEEKIQLCRVVTDSGADFIKTSTGFSTGGATPEDVRLMRTHVGAEVKVKAAGGISNLTDAANMMAMGADRLGTSRVVKAVAAMETNA
jgi:deoxyribose-phosphate aldolase